MTDPKKDKYSASEQGLGYIYQPRLALLRLFDLPEDTAVLLEKDDDLDFVDKNGFKSLASLKHNAILDYYRAFEQRSEWARENLILAGEIEDYEDRLVEEWGRYRDIVLEELDEAAADEVLQKAGKEIYKWAEIQSGNIESLRIRARVTEPYVTRGSFHILADDLHEPKVYWHPRFLERLDIALKVPE